MGVKPKKRFGQNFLVDQKVVAGLVAAAELTEADTVIEVGAGTGVLTKELVKQAGKVVAFELDRDLIPVLKKELQDFDNVKILNQDFLRFTIVDLPAGKTGLRFTNYKLVGSIPYQITSPLIHKLLTLDPRPSLVVLLIQKEVAEKITAQPPKATYLSNITELLGGAEIVRPVSKNAFRPVPAVDGTIIKIVPDTSLLKIENSKIENFLSFLHRGFQHPRKMLRSKFDASTLERCGIDPKRRAQTLAFEEWVKLYECYNSKG